jgi:hypothetical protein
MSWKAYFGNQDAANNPGYLVCGLVSWVSDSLTRSNTGDLFSIFPSIKLRVLRFPTNPFTIDTAHKFDLNHGHSLS